jgi:glycosyltransferase involved in cell wall biosynthesis
MADPRATSVVIPAFCEGPAVAEVVTALHAAAPWKEIIVVDDGSTDDTGRYAAAAGARVLRHPYNKGNGASLKTGIRHATGDWVLMLDADGQHDPAEAARLVALLGDYDLVVGARAPGTQASPARRWGNDLLNALAGTLAERRIPDLTSGFRAARREPLVGFLHLLPNGFSSPTTTTLAFLRAGFNVWFEPVRARRRSGHSKIRFARDGARFFLILLKVVTIYSPLKIFVPVSAGAFILGVAYGLWTVVQHSRIPNGAVLLLMFAVMVFLVGLVSEQISTLRFESRHSALADEMAPRAGTWPEGPPTDSRAASPPEPRSPPPPTTVA